MPQQVQGGGIATTNRTVFLRATIVAFNSPDNCRPQGIIGGCLN